MNFFSYVEFKVVIRLFDLGNKFGEGGYGVVYKVYCVLYFIICVLENYLVWVFINVYVYVFLFCVL